MWGSSQGWNQWALQPAMFNDVPHEQIDWAALAKQWIQMQQTQPPDTSAPPVVPPVPPPSVTAPPILHPPPPGHGPLVPEEFHPEVPVNASIMKPPIGPAGMPEPFPNDRAFENEPAFLQKPMNNAYWNKSHWEPNAPGDVDDRHWPVPPPPPIEPVSNLISGKETYDYGHMHDNPPLAMQSIDYNHMSEYSYNQPYPPETPYDQYWSQVNAAPPPIAPLFLKKEIRSTTTSSTASGSLPVEEDTSQIDAAKRKHLPAWIREGLEKMEQERIKKLEKEKAEKEKAEKLAKAKLNSDTDLKDDVSNPVLVKSKFDSDSDADADVEEDNVSINKKIEVQKRSPSPVEDFRTEEEKRQEFMLQLRRVLTEILLNVTNTEMYSIAEETLRKENLKARQLASTASLTSVASGLRSLANYGTESEASEAEDDKDASDSDEELHRRIREKKKSFAIKQKKILAELERKELEEQNEALKLKNENKTASSELEDADNNKESEKPSLKEEKEPVVLIPPSDVLEPDSASIILFMEEKVDNSTEIPANTNSDKELKKSNNKDSHSSDSSSSSSESGSESGDKHNKKSDKIESEKNSDKRKNYKRDRSPSKKRRRRSSDSESSGRHHKSRKSYEESSRKSSSVKKKKKYKRSDSSSSSGSSARKKRYSSDSKRNRSRDRRSHSYDDRRHRRSSSPKSYRSSRDSHRNRDSYSHRHEKDKYLRRDKHGDKYYEYKRSPSPHRRSKLPKKYRSSRSPSSESEHSKKYKRTRAR